MKASLILSCVAFVSVVVGVGAVGRASVLPLNNSDFEQGPIFPTVPPTGWVLSANPNTAGVVTITAGTSQYVTLPDGATSGTDKVFFANAASPILLRNVTPYTFHDGDTYTVSMDIGGRKDITQTFNHISVSLFGIDSNSVIHHVLSQSYVNPTDFTAGFGNWTHVSTSAALPFSSGADGLAIYLDINFVGGNQPNIDNVMLEQTTTPIPEPASLGLLMLGSVIMLRRRRSI